MKIYIVTVGNQPPAWINEGLNHYSKRLNPSFSLVTKIIKPVIQKKNSTHNIHSSLAAESKKILSSIPKNSFTIALDEKGDKLNTRELYFKFNIWLESGKNLCFLIGGANGLDKSVKDRADFLLSLSPMTFAHPLALIVLTEQVYRVVSILKNHPYHRA